MRHGDAPHTLYGDGDRVLSDKGALETAITARYIKSNNHIKNYKIGHILCSSAQRNRQTLDILQEIIETDASVEYLDAIRYYKSWSQTSLLAQRLCYFWVITQLF